MGASKSNADDEIRTHPSTIRAVCGATPERGNEKSRNPCGLREIYANHFYDT